jgi:SAM-dependent methyltransferase
MSGEHPPVRDSLLAAGDGTVSKHTENFPAVAAAQLLDSQASVHDYDAHSGWGTHEGTLCPLIHCPEEMMGELMQLASIQSSTDCVLDIGCGDGRVVLAAARAGARGIGIDINPSLIRAAKARAKSDGLEHAVKFEECDLKHLHIGHPLLEGVSVVYLYLLPEVLEILLGLIRELLQRGVRVVTLDHHLPPPPKGFAVSGEALFGALRLYGAS